MILKTHANDVIIDIVNVKMVDDKLFGLIKWRKDGMGQLKESLIPTSLITEHSPKKLIQFYESKIKSK
jgi:hypothetical protein